MKILIVGQAPHQYNRFLEEGEKRGHQIDNCNTRELIISASQDNFEVKLRKYDFADYDLVYLLTLGNRLWDWLVAAKYINKKYGTVIVNNKVIDPTYSYYMTSSTAYQKQSELGLPFPKSVIVYSEISTKVAAKEFIFPVIVKFAESRKGKGVFKINSEEELYQFVKDKKEVTPSFIIREFIPNDGDIRVFAVGYKAIGAMKRTPHEGDFRSNISQGGTGEIFDLGSNPKVREVAEKAAKATRTEIAGVDIMLNKNTGEPYILEVNNGPQFKGLEQYTNVNAALEIIKYFETLVKDGSQ